jgi:hypothetical protein
VVVGDGSRQEARLSARQALALLAEGGLKPGAQWESAHALCQRHEGDPSCDWVHALCHRIEGDEGNAGYWYRRAGRTRMDDLAGEIETARSQLAGRDA